MLGRDDEQLNALERAHQGYLDRGEGLPAVRCAFWLGVHLLLRGELARTAGWFARAQRLLEREERDCVEQGYLLIAADLQHQASGDWVAASAAAGAAAEIAERFGDADLLALALMDQGRYLIRQERVEEGLGKLDEAMVAATAGELSPIVTGLVYCSVIDGCQEVHEPRRASEWTAAMTRWCDHQPGLVPFTGTCLMHRAELMQLRGDWGAALEEARLAGERFVAEVERRRRRSGVLPAGGDPSPPGRPRGGRAGLPRCEPPRVRAAAGSGAAAPGAGTDRRLRPPRSTRSWRERPRPGRAGEASAGLRRDHAGRRRSRAGASRLRRARGDRGELRKRDAARARWARPRGGRAGRRRCPRRPGRAAAGLEAVAGAGSAVRRRAGPRPRSRRPAGPSETTRRPHSSWRRPAPSSSSSGRRRISPESTRSPRAAATEDSRRPDGTRAAGAAPRRRRARATSRSPPSSSSASGRSTGT